MLIINEHLILNLLAGSVEDLATGRKTMLGGNEVAMLKFMVEHPNEPLTKYTLLEQVWHKKGVIVEESSLLHCISSCRKALRDKDAAIISTVRGVGYRFNGEIKNYEPKLVTPKKKAQPSSDKPQARTNWLTLNAHSGAYLATFALSALVSHWTVLSWNSPWVEADYTENFYAQCTLLTVSPVILNQVRAFETGNQVILVKEDGSSVSYRPKDVEVVCE
ncbi:winged helix-turn-helix domain-containing protein [Vibrio hepatarius]|uniref:winged helix-turn-helix domain-containing protein n=1 Tax=Vibrio hepatarius TaxID=171383 RepID=UPI001C08A1CF|nr:winged helix-turn-helix domain-containing protein [Vibrio hepatarius]MBU2899115.1 winged helix-turn-helix domain-containing protein [Vibrio hepatarius]